VATRRRPPSSCRVRTCKGSYLAFLGRISPEKRPDRAIEIAKQTGLPLKIAAKIDAGDRDYWKAVFEPMLRENASNVEYVGEINEQQKAEFLGNARALLFPVDWPGAIRPCDDRGNGVRNARGRLGLGFGAGSDRRRR
jgi:glycosyltransferase involved in cell wall biosynthesis